MYAHMGSLAPRSVVLSGCLCSLNLNRPMYLVGALLSAISILSPATDVSPQTLLSILVCGLTSNAISALSRPVYQFCDLSSAKPSQVPSAQRSTEAGQVDTVLAPNVFQMSKRGFAPTPWAGVRMSAPEVVLVIMVRIIRHGTTPLQRRRLPGTAVLGATAVKKRWCQWEESQSSTT